MAIEEIDGHEVSGGVDTVISENGTVITQEEEARRLADRYSVEFVDLNGFQIDNALFRSIPVDLMFRHKFVPLSRDEKCLDIVIADPTNILVVDELELLLGTPIRMRVGTERAIDDIIKKSESSQRVLEKASESFKLQMVQEDEDGDETLSIDRLADDSSPIIKLVDSMIFNAIQRRASDIHVETHDREVVVKYRIDGILHRAMDPIDKKFHGAMLSRIKVMSELDIAEKRVPQDGRFKMRTKNRTIDFRVSIMPSIHGEDAVIRILDKESINEEFKELRLDKLGFTGPELKKVRKYAGEPYGMFLVTGPTGSGKTTTLYAALSEIKSEEDKIITIEDPVEYQLQGVLQIPVNEKKGLTFARGLRSILRHDPDKIMVGEIRDAETAEIAVQSALTGHLVFTTVHANNVVDVIGRFLHMGLEPYNFVSALNCILAQRLVRVLCEHCKEFEVVSKQLIEDSGLDYDEYKDYEFPTGRGCIECNGTGFMGRKAILELLDLSDAVRQLILDRKSAAEVKREAQKEGMIFLRDSALQKVFAGETSLREVNKVTFVD